MYYKLVKSLLTPQECQLVSDIMLAKVEAGEWLTESCELAKGFYSIMPDTIIDKLLPVVSDFAQCKVNYNFDYGRIYPESESLKKHRDRTGCEYSITVCIKNTTHSFPFWVMNPDTLKPESFEMMPGDGLLYLATEVLHWREPNPHSDVFQSFIHFCDDATLAEVVDYEPRHVRIKQQAEAIVTRNKLKAMFNRPVGKQDSLKPDK